MTSEPLAFSKLSDTPKTSARWTKILLTTAALALGLHGLIEMASIFVLTNANRVQIQFAFRELTDQPAAVAVIGLVYGLMRWVSAGGILANRTWGWVLGVLVSLVTLCTLTLYIPAGASDAVLSGIALVGLVIARYGSSRLRA